MWVRLSSVKYDLGVYSMPNIEKYFKKIDKDPSADKLPDSKDYFFNLDYSEFERYTSYLNNLLKLVPNANSEMVILDDRRRQLHDKATENAFKNSLNNYEFSKVKEYSRMGYLPDVLSEIDSKIRFLINDEATNIVQYG